MEAVLDMKDRFDQFSEALELRSACELDALKKELKEELEKAKRQSDRLLQIGKGLSQ